MCVCVCVHQRKTEEIPKSAIYYEWNILPRPLLKQGVRQPGAQETSSYSVNIIALKE